MEAKKEAETALILHKQKKSSVEIAGIIGVSRATVYRYLEEMVSIAFRMVLRQFW